MPSCRGSPPQGRGLPLPSPKNSRDGSRHRFLQRRARPCSLWRSSLTCRWGRSGPGGAAALLWLTMLPLWNFPSMCSGSKLPWEPGALCVPRTHGGFPDRLVSLFGLLKARAFVRWRLLCPQLCPWLPMPWEESFCPGVSLAFAGGLPCTLGKPRSPWRRGSSSLLLWSSCLALGQSPVCLGAHPWTQFLWL